MQHPVYYYQVTTKCGPGTGFCLSVGLGFVYHMSTVCATIISNLNNAQCMDFVQILVFASLGEYPEVHTFTNFYDSNFSWIFLVFLKDRQAHIMHMEKSVLKDFFEIASKMQSPRFMDTHQLLGTIGISIYKYAYIYFEITQFYIFLWTFCFSFRISKYHVPVVVFEKFKIWWSSPRSLCSWYRYLTCLKTGILAWQWGPDFLFIMFIVGVYIYVVVSRSLLAWQVRYPKFSTFKLLHTICVFMHWEIAFSFHTFWSSGVHVPQLMRQLSKFSIDDQNRWPATEPTRTNPSR